MELKLTEVIASLGSLDESDRCYAVEDLEQIGTPIAIPYLMKALQDSSVRVREAAVEVLIKVGGSGVAEETVKLLSSEVVEVRNAATEILESLGVSAIDSLVACFNSSSGDVRKFAIDTAGKIIRKGVELQSNGISALIPALIDRLSDSDVNVSGASAEALGFPQNNLAIPFLLNTLLKNPTSYWLQCNIIVALSRISSDLSLKALQNVEKNILCPESQEFLEMALDGVVL